MIMPISEEIKRKVIEFYWDELKDSALYEELAKDEKDEDLKRALIELSKIESKHASFWKEYLIRKSIEVLRIKIKRSKIILLRLLRRDLELHS